MEMMSKEMVLAMVEECEAEERKTVKVYPMIKYRGQMRQRSYPDYIYTERYKELFFDPDCKYLRSDAAKIFHCECCGEKVGYWDLEAWACDFDGDVYTCSCCYEDEMGDDL